MQLKDNMSNIEKIRQEIERRREANKRQYLSSNGEMSWQRMCGEEDCLVELLAFIDSLPEETCKDSLQVPETCKENTDSFTSLEEAANDSWVLYEYRDTPQGLYSSCYRDGFIAGAEWQANQLLKGSPLPEDTVLFQKGVEEGKRLMMEEAVEGEIGYWNQRGLSIRLDQSLERLGYDEDTKVKIIIVKKKEE